MIVLPALSSVNDILDTDLILVEHSTGESFKMTGADLKALMNAQAVDTVALNNMHSVTSNAVAQALSSLIKVKKVTVNNVVLDQNGVLNIESYIPSDINLLFALMWNWGAVSMDNYFGVSGDGRYIRGTPNNTINWIVVAYFYVD